MYGVHFRYVPGGPLYPYRLDYPTKVEAVNAAATIAANGFWYQRPLHPTAFLLKQRPHLPALVKKVA